MISNMARVFLFCLLLLFLAGTSLPAQPQNSINFEGNTDAPEFPGGLTWLNTDEPIQLKKLRGKFVLLDFWTFCCINCMHVIPDLKKLEAKYDQELVVIGVHSAKFENEKDTDQIRQAVLRYGVRHPVVNDADFKVWNRYGARAWPTFVLINPNGRVIGSMSGEGVYEPIDRILTMAIPHFEKKGELHRSPLELSLEEAKQPETLLSYPGKIFADPESKRLFITDSNHNRILVTTADGKILDVIGNGEEGKADGSFDEAELNHPQGTFLHQGVLYIADTENHLIRAADLKSRTLKTVLGTGEQARRINVPGQGTTVAIASPWDVLIHDRQAYIAMAGTHQIWSADIDTWHAQPFAGSARENLVDDRRLKAALAQTSGLARSDTDLFFADSETSSIRKVDLKPDGEVKTLVGTGLFDFGSKDGPCKQATLQHPLGLTVAEEKVYVADTYNSRIRVIDLEKCSVSTLAGSGLKELKNGKLNTSSFNEPGGVAWLQDRLYVADTNNHVIRIVDLKTKTVSSLELTNLEKLSANLGKGKKSRFSGREVRLPDLEVEPGKTEIALSFTLPQGYKMNENAPFYLQWNSGDSNEIRFENQASDLNLKKPEFPLMIRIADLKQSRKLRIDTVVYYCTSEQSVCLVDRISASAQIRPVDTGANQIPVAIEVKNPGKM